MGGQEGRELGREEEECKRTGGGTQMKEEKRTKKGCLQCARQLPGSEGSVDRAGEGVGVGDSWQ